MVLRPDKQARAALNNFDVWYSQQWSQSQLLTFPIANSTVTLFRRAAPHSMLYFLIQVLHRMLHQFWPTALSDDYVKQCRISNGRCPPSIIALLFYFECRDLSPYMRVAIPATNKQRLYDSETARAAARLTHQQVQPQRHQVVLQRLPGIAVTPFGKRLQKKSCSTWFGRQFGQASFA